MKLISRELICGGLAAIAVAFSATANRSQTVSTNSQYKLTGASGMQLTQEWDKKFPKSNKVDHQKVTFKNRYGITLAADLYLPKDRSSKRLAALAISGPFGAVKEQSSGLYAQT